MKRKLNLDSWERQEHFNLFKNYDEPFHSVCIRLECQAAYKLAKEKGISFYLYYLYQSLKAAQVIEAFKYRILNEEVFIFEQVDAGSTIPRNNGTFGFGDFKYFPTLEEFADQARKVIENVKRTTQLERSAAENVIRYSALPWIDFTSLSHARLFGFRDSCPKISFGKMSETNGVRSMPVSIHVHHALVDGYHLGQYIECYQDLMNNTT
ncbi:MAG: chloramphenicol acetyltransferase [Bacteroidota bacterium]